MLVITLLVGSTTSELGAIPNAHICWWSTRLLLPLALRQTGKVNGP
jgi:hypothetical protein